MNANKSTDVDQYLSVKRIVLLSFAITASFYVLWTFIHYFGRPNFTNPDLPSPPGLGVTLLLNIPLTFILVFVVFLYNRKIMSVRFKWQRDEVVAIVLGSFLIALVMSSLITILQLKIWPNPPGPPKTTFNRVMHGWLGDLPLMAMALLTSYLLRSLYQEKTVAVENASLRAENIRTRYEALKNQIDPHFLFNSLNTLKTLIGDDAQKAEDFVQQLSSVLRYTLQNKEVATLAEEIDCVRAYCIMMKIRYGDNLVFDHHIDHGRYDHYLVLPLSVQGLMENAIKHNVISSKLPLTVSVSTDDDNRLIIINKIQPKIEKEEGSGIGLANLLERYRLKWNENVEIFDDGMIFKVTLPLKENENKQ